MIRAAEKVLTLAALAWVAAHPQDSRGFTPLMRLLQVPSGSKEGGSKAADATVLQQQRAAAAALRLLARPELDWAVAAQEPSGGRRCGERRELIGD